MKGDQILGTLFLLMGGLFIFWFLDAPDTYPIKVLIGSVIAGVMGIGVGILFIVAPNE